MSHHDISRQIRAYTIGFGLALVTTVGAFALVMSNTGLSRGATIAGVVLLALCQLGIQLIYFLHLGREAKPRLNAMAFAFMTMVVLIIGLGSLWVMHNLDYHMMPRDLESHMEKEENITNDNHSQHH